MRTHEGSGKGLRIAVMTRKEARGVDTWLTEETDTVARTIFHFLTLLRMGVVSLSGCVSSAAVFLVAKIGPIR